jgi:hypothetical protein
VPSTSRDGGEYFGTRRKYRRDLAEYLDGTPTWREGFQAQVDSVKEMVMTGEPVPLYTWKG